jgi:hypothetical protein
LLDQKKDNKEKSRTNECFRSLLFSLRLTFTPCLKKTTFNLILFATYFFCLDTEKVTKRDQEIVKAIFQKLFFEIPFNKS